MTETTPRREATRLRLVEAAIREFAARGIDATSVEMLCEAAGFTRGAFYSNFVTKDDLCVAILEHYNHIVTDALATAFSEPPGTADVEWVIDHALPDFFSIIAPSAELHVTLAEIRLRATRNPDLAKRIDEIANQLQPVMVRFIDDKAERVGIRFAVPTDQLINAFEALFFHDLTKGPGANSLIGELTKALAVRREEVYG